MEQSSTTSCQAAKHSLDRCSNTAKLLGRSTPGGGGGGDGGGGGGGEEGGEVGGLADDKAESEGQGETGAGSAATGVAGAASEGHDRAAGAAGDDAAAPDAAAASQPQPQPQPQCVPSVAESLTGGVQGLLRDLGLTAKYGAAFEAANCGEYVRGSSQPRQHAAGVLHYPRRHQPTLARSSSPQTTHG